MTADLTERLWWYRYRASKWRHEWRDLVSHKVARVLPRRLRYWVLIDMGAAHIHGNEIVPDVPFMTVLERASSGSSAPREDDR